MRKKQYWIGALSLLVLAGGTGGMQSIAAAEASGERLSVSGTDVWSVENSEEVQLCAEGLGAEAPVAEVPVTEPSAAEPSAAETPATEVPVTEMPSTEAPVTETPATEAPSTEAPATEAPVAEGDASGGESKEDGQLDTEHGGESILDEGSSTLPQEPETESSGLEETPQDPNQDAFDMIILEDENGIMEQESQTAPDQGQTDAGAELGDALEMETEKETESAKEKDAKPDIEITLLKETVTDWGETLFDFQAYPVGDLSENQAKIYRFLREELGLNKAAASGVLANIESESNFSPVALGDGGTSYGLCQWHAGRFSNLVNWCRENGYDYHLLEGQLAYLKQELEGGYRGVLEYLRQVPDTARGAYQAGYYWCMYYEIPSDTVNRSIYRGKAAMERYFPADLDFLGQEASWRLGERQKEILDTMMLIEDPGQQVTAVAEFFLHIGKDSSME